jgi:hypothetical protein
MATAIYGEGRVLLANGANAARSMRQTVRGWIELSHRYGNGFGISARLMPDLSVSLAMSIDDHGQSQGV